MNKIEEVKLDFEANLLDGDKINDCGGAMLSTKHIWEWLEPKLQEVRAETIRECNKKTMSIIEQVVLEDAIIKFNSTPQIGELFDIEKHNHANKMLNGMNSYIYEKLKEYFSH